MTENAPEGVRVSTAASVRRIHSRAAARTLEIKGWLPPPGMNMPARFACLPNSSAKPIISSGLLKSTPVMSRLSGMSFINLVLVRQRGVT